MSAVGRSPLRLEGDDPAPESAHFREGGLEELEVGCVFRALAGFRDELGFEDVFGFAHVVFVEDSEGAGPRLAGEFKGGDFVGDVMAIGVFRRAVIFLFLNE